MLFSLFMIMINKKILCWNCRGILASETSARLFHLIRSHRPALVCLVETRANSPRVDKFCKNISRSWNWTALLADGFSGGIIVLWRKSLGVVSPVAVSRRALHLVISPSSSITLLISVVYNANRLSSQRNLWTELSRLAALDLPWLLVGDFNTIVNRSEHKGGSFLYYSRKANFFLNFIDSNNLFDFNFSGFRFTWCNNQSGLARRWARLDRCLANASWLSTFASYSLIHLPRIFSDHAPLLLSFSSNPSRKNNSFKFENFLV